MAKELICVSCGSVGRPKVITKGSFILEVVLWLFFIVPGVIYSVWRLASKYQACPSCGSKEIVPLDSPRGRELASKYATNEGE